MKPGDIYLATVGIEQYRWASPKRSSIDLEEYVGRAAEAGFDGLEIWEHHASGLGREGMARVRGLAEGASCPVTVFSAYVETVPTDENVGHRRRVTDAARLLGASAYKYNVSGPSREEAVRFVRDWAAETDATFLCECHAGTLVEDPEVAAEVTAELLSAGQPGGPGRFGAILHTLTAEDDEFERDLGLKKDLFRHVHVQRAGEHRPRLAERVARLKEVCPQLTWSIEFSSPVYEKADNETCFRGAVEDMRLLRECLG